MKFYLHCGAHRTGTTTLQKSIEKQRDALLAQGVYASSHGDDFSSVLRSAKKNSDYGKIAEFIESKVVPAGATQVSVSDENLICMSSGALQGGIYRRKGRFMDLLEWLNANYEFRVIFSTRQTDKFLESIYLKDSLNAGMRGELPKSFDTFVADIGVPVRKLSWRIIMDDLSQRAPTTFLHLGAGGASFTEFQDRIARELFGENVSFEYSTKSANRSPNRAVLDLYEALYEYLPAENRAAVFEEMHKTLLKHGVGNYPELLSDDDRAALVANYLEDQKDLATAV